MKKIALHAPILDDRGNGTGIQEYALALKHILGYDPVIVSSKESIKVKERFSEFDCVLYDNPNEFSNIIENKKIDIAYMLAGGGKESYTPTNCKTAIHCVFSMTEPHGDVYAGVSRWLAAYFNHTAWVPYIINIPKTVDTMRSELGIPSDAFVIGRLGGYKQFDVKIAHESIRKVLDRRSDLWAVFLNTMPFIDHPRVKYLPSNTDKLYRAKFINTCDAMIHARSDGETFGIAVGEFSSFNKPIFTYDADYWWYMRAHLDILGEKALKYKNEKELTSYLLQIDKDYIRDVEWDCYSENFSPKNVIDQFNKVFLT